MTAAEHSSRATTVAFLVACLGISSFAGMDVLMKGLSIELGVYNAMLWRSYISVSLAGLLYLITRPVWPSRSVLRVHVWRGFVTSIMAWLFFWGLARVPIAEAIALTFIAPLLALYLAAVLLGERIARQSIWASVIGMIGAIIIIGGRLGSEYNEETAMGIAALLLSAILYSYNLILQRQQALVANPIEIAFFQNGTVVVLYSLLAVKLAVVPSVAVVPELAAAAILGIVSTLLISWAYARAEAQTLIPVEYTAFVWGALFGWLVFAETVTVATLVGTTLIVAGCLVAARQKPEHVDHVETTAI